MNSNNQALTVGELTIAIGILILASLIWSGFNKQKDANQKSVQIENQICPTEGLQNKFKFEPLV